jgi:anti-sigma factor RsiW
MTMHGHEDYEENLAAYVLGALPPLEAELFERHLSDCATCSGELQRLAPVREAMARSVPSVEPPPSLKASLMETVRAEVAQREPTPSRRRFGRRPRLAFAGALAALALGIVIGVAAVKIGSEPATRTIAAQVNHLPHTTASLELSSDARSATVKLKGAPRLARGRVYQLWVQLGKRIKRGPVFTVNRAGQGSRTIPGGVRRAKAVMVTVERAPGAPAPTRAPILRFDV